MAGATGGRPGGPRRATAAVPPALAAAILAGALAAAPGARAGPPYATDDPEPVEFRHWELYLATQDQWSRGGGWAGTSPHLEVNYGALPDLQLHLLAPLAWGKPPGAPASLGYGDTELGAKLRFLREGEWTPQLGTFPLVEVPTGDAARGLGSGRAQLFLPLWLQKSFGRWTTYGGGGYWLNPGLGNRNWWFLGWQAQRQVASGLTLGAEVVHATSRRAGASGDTRFDVGLVADFGERHHLMLSAGGALGATAFQAYAAYQLTVGPEAGPPR